MLTDDTVLYRQVIKEWILGDRISSQAFRPFDGGKLSTYDGDMISAEEAFIHYTKEIGNKSDAVAWLTVGEFKFNDLEIIPDRQPYKEHISVDFSKHSKSQIKRISRILANMASDYGFAYRPGM